MDFKRPGPETVTLRDLRWSMILPRKPHFFPRQLVGILNKTASCKAMRSGLASDPTCLSESDQGHGILGIQSKTRHSISLMEPETDHSPVGPTAGALEPGARRGVAGSCPYRGTATAGGSRGGQASRCLASQSPDGGRKPRSWRTPRVGSLGGCEAIRGDPLLLLFLL